MRRHTHFPFIPPASSLAFRVVELSCPGAKRAFVICRRLLDILVCLGLRKWFQFAHQLNVLYACCAILHHPANKVVSDVYVPCVLPFHSTGNRDCASWIVPPWTWLRITERSQVCICPLPWQSVRAHACCSLVSGDGPMR
jgi:hypothetical protein